ncbi:hypothetical protein OHB00_34145 [Streptomyces sp. NBC_00631]|uniref:hypothetical protein n=1 Tax=Streptomyces sp. NBC_00631 TaxID=2975793 RepID=UPI0030DFF42C
MGDLLTPIIAAASALLGVDLTGAINARSDKRKDEALERQQLHQESVQERNHLRELDADRKSAGSAFPGSNPGAATRDTKGP